MKDRKVSILGATGQVGSFVARTLQNQNVNNLRLGARNPDTVEKLAQTLKAEPVQTDLHDDAALRAFCQDSFIVINCAGPSYAVLDRVALAADQAGAHYVDVSGDGPAYHLLLDKQAFGAGNSAILSAGMLPGLANLAPSLIAHSFGGQLTVYSGGAECLSYTAAADLVLSLNEGQSAVSSSGYWYGEAYASWELGRRVSRNLLPLEEVELDFFPGRVSALPFLSADSERLAMRQKLSRLRWYNVFSGKHLKNALTRIRGALDNGTSTLDEAIDAVSKASELDLFGLRPYYVMVFVLEQHSSPTRRVVIQSESSAHLTGATAASATLALLRGGIPPGLYFADDVLDPVEVVQDVEAFDSTTLVTTQVMELEEVEEGML